MSTSIYKFELNKRQSCHHIETSQLTGFHMMATLAFNELRKYILYCQGPFNFAEVSISLQKNKYFLANIVLLLKSIV